MAKKTSKLDLLNKVGASSVEDLYKEKNTTSEKKEARVEEKEEKKTPEPKPAKTPKAAPTLNKIEKELVKYKEGSDATNREIKSISIDRDVSMDAEDVLRKLKRKGHNISFSLAIEQALKKMVEEYDKLEG